MAPTYMPLPDPSSWIRLLTVDSSEYNEDTSPPLWVYTEHVPLDTAPAYHALSYEWGTETTDANTKVYVNHQPLRVPKTLYRFLRRLSAFQPLSHAYFWADAICLDQTSEEEKMAQIPLMGRIYRNAVDVNCWLGLPTNREKTLLTHLSLATTYTGSGPVARQDAPKLIRQQFHDLFQRAHRTGGHGTLSSKVEIYLSLRNSCINALAEFLQKSYWSRLWMVQEIALAKRLIFFCGDWSFSGEELDTWLPHAGPRGATDCILDLFGLFDDNGESVPFSTVQPPWEADWRILRHGRAALLMEYRRSSQELSLLQCVEAFGLSACSKPYDRVYGMLGLAKTNSKGAFCVRKNPTAREVFFDTLQYCENDLGKHTMKFARKLWAMMELSVGMVLDPVPYAAIPSGGRYTIELEEEKMLTKPELHVSRFRSVSRFRRHYYTFEIRPSNDLTSIGIGAILRMSLASAMKIYAVTSAHVVAADILVRVRSTSSGFVYDHRTRALKGRYCVSKQKDSDTAKRLANAELSHPNLRILDRSADKLVQTIVSRHEIFSLAADIDGDFALGDLPRGFGIAT